jgi:hypothetical protein
VIVVEEAECVAEAQRHPGKWVSIFPESPGVDVVAAPLEAELVIRKAYGMLRALLSQYYRHYAATFAMDVVP